jgi:hypothetical protein
MRRRQRQGAAGERQIIGDQPRAERGQEMVSAISGAGLVEQPRKSDGQLHAGDNAVAAETCHHSIVTQVGSWPRMCFYQGRSLAPHHRRSDPSPHPGGEACSLVSDTRSRTEHRAMLSSKEASDD